MVWDERVSADGVLSRFGANEESEESRPRRQVTLFRRRLRTRAELVLDTPLLLDRITHRACERRVAVNGHDERVVQAGLGTGLLFLDESAAVLREREHSPFEHLEELERRHCPADQHDVNGRADVTVFDVARLQERLAEVLLRRNKSAAEEELRVSVETRGRRHDDRTDSVDELRLFLRREQSF